MNTTFKVCWILFICFIIIFNFFIINITNAKNPAYYSNQCHYSADGTLISMSCELGGTQLCGGCPR